MSEKAGTIKKIITFVILTAAISSIYWTLIISKHSLEVSGGTYVLGLMWSPGLAAIITSLIYGRRMSEFGWAFKWRYQLGSYLIPIGYALVAYLVIWISGVGKFYDPKFVDQVSQVFGWGSLPAGAVILFYVLLHGTIGMVTSSASALGEEIGWRGFLVPELSKVTSFTGVGLISGIIWASWHYPELIFANYNGGTPAWYSLTCFTVMVIAMSFIYAWMRLKSGSVWTGVFLHASHNLFIQSIFTPLTLQTDKTKWFIDEFGAALPVICVLLAIVFWTRRKQLRNPAVTSQEQFATAQAD